MKILYVITMGKWGGAQRNVLELAEQFSKNNDVIVAIGRADEKNELGEYLNQQKIKTLQVANLKRSISLINDFKALFELKKLYITHKPNIVHLHSSKAGIIGTFAAILVKKENRPKIIYTVHGWVFKEKINLFKKILYIKLEFWASIFRNAIIVLGVDELNAGKKIFIQEKKMQIIKNGIDPNKKYLIKEKAIEEIFGAQKINVQNKTIFGCIATFYKNKGLDTLIDAAKIVKENNNNFIIACVGGGADKQNLEEKIKLNKLQENVFLFDFIKNAEEKIKAFDALIIPSKKEGLPYILLEAFNAGVPVITTDVGAIKDVATNGENAIVVNANNPNEIAESILNLMSGKFDLNKIKENEVTTAKKLSLNIFYEKIEKLYSSI